MPGRFSFLLLSFAVINAPLRAQQPTRASNANRQAPLSEPEVVRRLTASVDSLTRIGQFSGVVVLAKNGVPVYQVAKGYADRERKIANNLQTAFNLGSINKVFTQISVPLEPTASVA